MYEYEIDWNHSVFTDMTDFSLHEDLRYFCGKDNPPEITEKGFRVKNALSDTQKELLSLILTFTEKKM